MAFKTGLCAAAVILTLSWVGSSRAAPRAVPACQAPQSITDCAVYCSDTNPDCYDCCSAFDDESYARCEGNCSNAEAK
jgi:hypothetical protein